MQSNIIFNNTMFNNKFYNQAIILMTVAIWSLLLSITPASATSLKPVTIEPLTENTWLHISGAKFGKDKYYYSNGLIVKRGDSLILIDTAWGAAQTRELLALIKQQINLPVTAAIVTHWHDDRAGGSDVLKSAGIEVFAQPMTLKLAKVNNKPVPENAILELAQAGKKVSWQGLELLYPGPAHSMDNIVVWLPQQKMLIGGCAVRSLGAKNLGYTDDGDVSSWPQAIEHIESHFNHADIVVPGHGKVGDNKLFSHTKQLAQKHLAK